MEKEEKIVFQIEKIGDQTSVKIDVNSEEDVFILAFGIGNALKNIDGLNEMLIKIRLLELTDEEYRRKAAEKTVSVPDFDKILKDIK